MTTVLRFATTTPPSPVTVDTFGTLSVKSDYSSAVRDDLRLPTMHDTLRHSWTLADACERLGTLGGHKRNDLASPPGPLDPNLKTGTLLRSIREKAFL